MSDKEQPQSENEPTEMVDEERREVVVRLGKLAAYTPPAVMAMLVSRKATAQSVGTAQ